MSVIGKSEEEVIKAGIRHEIGVARFRENSRGQILGLRDGILKLSFGLDDRKLLGVHIVGEGATELIHIDEVVLAFNGTLDYFVDTVVNYPTLADTYKIAALDAYNRFRTSASSVIGSRAELAPSTSLRSGGIWPRIVPATCRRWSYRQSAPSLCQWRSSSRCRCPLQQCS
jgi:hypothetical protein